MSDTTVLDAQMLEEVFLDCLFKKGEDTSDTKVAEGIVQTFGFHPVRLESHRDEIVAMLGELPDDFRESGGGGMSFLSACYDRHGNHWGEHRNIEQLVCLGVALGVVHYQLPRELWQSLPGGMPYFTISV